MFRTASSPIIETFETWPLAGAYRMRWGQDVNGDMWVTVENGSGECETVLPYQHYLDMEHSEAVVRELPRNLDEL
jgi:hypothetical protein